MTVVGLDDDAISPQGLAKNFANEKRNNGSSSWESACCVLTCTGCADDELMVDIRVSDAIIKPLKYLKNVIE